MLQLWLKEDMGQSRSILWRVVDGFIYFFHPEEASRGGGGGGVRSASQRASQYLSSRFMEGRDKFKWQFGDVVPP